MALPENVLNIIPPRPPEYYGIGELMPKRSGAALDPLAAAEALVNYELAFLFNPQRANRLVQFKARANTLGFDDVLSKIMQTTWKAPALKGLNREIQLQTRQMVLTHLLALSQSEQANYSVKATCFEYLNRIKIGAYGGGFQWQYAIERIEKEKAKDLPLPQHRDMPPGAPIGCDED